MLAIMKLNNLRQRRPTYIIDENENDDDDEDIVGQKDGDIGDDDDVPLTCVSSAEFFGSEQFQYSY
jgi:hypothetical protein